MAEPISIQQLKDASLDVKSLEEVVNGDENVVVTTRLGETYPSVKGSILKLFENGGLPATPFETKALMEASELADGSYAVVTNDEEPLNRGIYLLSEGTWVKSLLDFRSIVKDKLSVFTNFDEMLSNLGEYSNGDIVLLKEGLDRDYLYKKTDTGWVRQTTSIEQVVLNTFEIKKYKNLFDVNKVLKNYQLNNDGKLWAASTGQWTTSAYIPVIAGKMYAISGNRERHGLSFFKDMISPDEPISYTTSAIPAIFTAPEGANYLVLNLTSKDFTAFSNIMVEESEEYTEYSPNSGLYLNISKSSLPEDIVYRPEFIEKTTKNYELTVASKNLFDVSKTVTSQYLNSTNGKVMRSTKLAGFDKWLTSDFIPIDGGNTYTLSGIRGRRGLSFFAEKSVNDIDNSIAGDLPLLYIGSEDMPLTVTAPSGANYAIFNIHSDPAQPHSNLMLELGDSATSYMPYGVSTKIDPSFILTKPAKQSLSKLVVNDDMTGSIVAGGVNLGIKFNGTPLNADASVFNFVEDSVDGVVVRNLGDDVAPLRADGFTIAANHGFIKNTITATHNKTAADIGSVWSDGTEEFIIIDVISSNKLAVTARSSNGQPRSALNHVSGASNTAAISVSNSVYGQMYPVIKDHTVSLLVDGNKVGYEQSDEYSYQNNVAVHESYSVMAKADVVEWIIANGGKKLTEYKAEPSLICNYSYVFDKDGGCTIYSSLTCLKAIDFTDYMVTQSGKMLSDDRKYYVPKSIPFGSYDFTGLQPMPSPIPATINFDTTKVDTMANPVDRLLQFVGNVGYATGYLPILDAEPEIRKTNASNKYLEIRNNSLKVYPRLIDGLKNRLEVGDSFAAVAYRKYFKSTVQRTAKYVVRSQIADFLYLDWHSAKTDVIELDSDLVGRAFTVHEKSSNVTVLSKFATNNIAVKIDATKSYGYLVLRFDK